MTHWSADAGASFLVGSTSSSGGMMHEVTLKLAWVYSACASWQGAGVSAMEMNAARTQLMTGSMDGLLEVARINGLSLAEIASECNQAVVQHCAQRPNQATVKHGTQDHSMISQLGTQCMNESVEVACILDLGLTDITSGCFEDTYAVL